jgi:proline iminopeptidase
MRVHLNETELYFDVASAALAIVDGKLIARPTLIVLHGGPGSDHGYLRPGLDPLREHAQIMYIDLRGQGRSGRPPLASCTLEQMADDVAALCGVLGIERPIIFGHSAGGFVALHLAIRHPALPGGLILCDTAPTARVQQIEEGVPSLAERAGPDALAEAKRLFAGDISAESLKRFRDLVSPFYAAPQHMDVLRRAGSLSTTNLEVMRYFWGTLASHYDVRAALGGIRAPTLVIVGRYDWVHPPAASRTIAEGIPGAKLIELANSGHLGFSEEPERFRAAVIAFLNEAPG